VGEDVGTAGARSLDFSLHLWDHVPGDELSVKLNGASVEGLQPTDPDRKPEEGQWLQTALDGSQVKRGENRFEVAVSKRGESASSPVVLDTVQLRVRFQS